MKNWIVLIGLLLVACSDKAPVVAPLDTSTLEAPVAESIDSARRAVQANTLDPSAWATYAEVLQAHQLLNEAAEAWSIKMSLADLTPGEAILTLRCAEGLARPMPKVDQAIDQILQATPDHTSLRFSRGSTRLRGGDLVGAQEDLERAVNQERHPAILLALARTVLSQGDATRARSLLEEARQKASGDPDIQKTLAPVYLQLGESELADRERSRVLRGPKALRFDEAELRMANRAVSSTANDDRAREAFANRDWQVAMVWLNKILEVHPDRAAALARRGMCHLMTNQMQKADQDFRKAIAEDESLAMAHRGLGVLAGRGGRPKEAVTHLARAIELNPEDPDALGMYPIALLKAGQIPEAEMAYETARARFPKNRILVQQWLVGLRSMGRADQGLVAARTALQDLGEDAAVLHHAALCLEALGQVQEAMEYHRRSVAADPKSPSASRLQKTGTPG